jgi:hypothetical protein
MTTRDALAVSSEGACVVSCLRADTARRNGIEVRWAVDLATLHDHGSRQTNTTVAADLRRKASASRRGVGRARIGANRTPHVVQRHVTCSLAAEIARTWRTRRPGKSVNRVVWMQRRRYSLVWVAKKQRPVVVSIEGHSADLLFLTLVD